MKPGSFTVKILTEGADCYSIRLGVLGRTIFGSRKSAHPAPVYELYIMKATLNSEGTVEEERSLRIGKDSRFRLEYMGTEERAWTETGSPTSEALHFYYVCSSYNYRVVETKTEKIMYTVTSLFSISDAVRANFGEFPAAMS